MAILDKQGLQHYANKMCNADNRKVGSKSLPTALNDIDTAIDGFKTLFETEYGTPVNMELENNENIFSVGTGTNVDRRSEVENSFTDVELSGNSLVNLSETKQRLNQTHAHYGDVYLCESSRLKANTSYRLEYDFECNIDFTFYKCYLGYSTSKGSMIIESSIKFDAKKGKNILNFTLTQSELDNAINNNFKYFMVRVFIDPDKKEKTYSTKNVMLLEGDYTNKPIPQYFEGMKSVGQDDVNGHKIEILSNNKNLLNLSNVTRNAWGVTVTYNQGVLNINGTLSNEKDNGLCDYYLCGSWTGEDDNLKLKPNTKYTFSGNVPNYVEIYIIHNAKVLCQLNGVYNNNSFTNSSHGRINAIMVRVKKGFTFSNTTINIQIEEGSTSTSFIAPNLNKKEISLNEPLRGLPNGTRDTIEKINGEWKIVRRCLGYDVTSLENWAIRSSLDKTLTFHCSNIPLKSFKDYANSNSKMLCNKFICEYLDGSDAQYIMGRANGDGFIMGIEKSNLPSEDVNGFKSWLLENKVSVVMELETPIIEDISPITLQCWKNGTISIDEVLPVETTHTVALNKSAQIQKNIEELATLRNRVKALEEQYDKTALNQAYEVELLRLDMQLDNII